MQMIIPETRTSLAREEEVSVAGVLVSVRVSHHVSSKHACLILNKHVEAVKHQLGLRPILNLARDERGPGTRPAVAHLVVETLAIQVRV